MRKGVKFTNILIFIGAWSTTKLPMILFEISSLGIKFAISRFVLNIFGILMIAYAVNQSLSDKEIQVIYENAREEEDLD